MLQEYKNTRIQEYKKTRIHEYKNTRIQEYKKILQYWPVETYENDCIVTQVRVYNVILAEPSFWHISLLTLILPLALKRLLDKSTGLVSGFVVFGL